MGNEKGPKMEATKYYLIFSDDEDIADYIEDNSIEGFLTIEDDHISFNADNFNIDLDNVDIEEDENNNIIISTGYSYYTFSLNDIESLE